MTSESAQEQGGIRRSLSIVIPTFGRERVLLDTLAALLGLAETADEILVVDQTAVHEPETDAALGCWAEEGRVRWLRLPRPSIPHAMNVGLQEARSEVVLFLDDDIVPDGALVAAHRRAQASPEVVGVTGMVLQPGEIPVVREESAIRGDGLRRDLGFPFNSTTPTEIWNVMAGNLSVKREAALACGGFDERFLGVAYRFETEFARRLRRRGGRILFEPTAVIRHLRAPSGGTRAWGRHQTSARPEHSVGDYYFALLEGRGVARWAYIGRRVFREPISRFTLGRPWLIPAKLAGEIRGLSWALQLARRKVRSE